MLDFYVLILFNTKKAHLGNNMDPKWLDYRLDIFRRYTLQSLINQTSSFSRIWMLCSPESETILAPKVDMLKKRYPAMATVDFIFDDKAACDNLIQNSDPILVLKIDSDDAYRNDTIARTRSLLAYRYEISLLMFCNGYIYDIKTRKMSVFTRWSMGSYAVWYPAGTFDYRRFQKYCLYDQTKVREKYNPRLDMSYALCCLDHDMNLHNDPRRKGVEIGQRTGQRDCPQRTDILLNYFGMEG